MGDFEALPPEDADRTVNGVEDDLDPDDLLQQENAGSSPDQPSDQTS